LEGERYLTRPRAAYSGENGKPLAAGAMLRNPAYARTLRRIAAGGADAFYAGEIAQDVVDTANSHPTNPGDLTLADLAGYAVKVRTPVCDSYRGYRICGFPLPSSGGLTVLQMLKMLEPYDLAAMGPASFWAVHFISEAGRLAYADRGVCRPTPTSTRRRQACSTRRTCAAAPR
jgi:gamma-glutamyltranspeptidase/glutathione hydrolase